MLREADPCFNYILSNKVKNPLRLKTEFFLAAT